MDEVLQRLKETRHTCQRAGDDLSNAFAINPTEPPISAFAMCFNTTTLALEVCDYYDARFRSMNATNAANIELARQQNGERIVLQTKMHFLFALSAMECAARGATENYPAALSLDPTKKWQYLSSILGKSHAMGMIDATTKKLWDGLIVIRNTIVHNNGMAHEDHDFDYPDGTTVSTRKGLMVQGNLLTFANLSHWAIESYAAWCQSFLQRACVART